MAKSLSEHAAYELTASGMTNSDDPEARQTAINAMALVRRIEKQKNSPHQIDFLVTALDRLLHFKAMSPITDAPDEWDEYEVKRYLLDPVTHEETGKVKSHKVWLNKRDPNIMSYDGGETFADQATGKQGQSISAEEAEKRRQEIQQFKAPVTGIDSTVPAAEMTAAGDENSTENNTLDENVKENGTSVDNAEAEVNKEETN